MPIPDVLESAAFGVPSELGEQDVMIVVQPRAGRPIDPPELGEFLSSKLPRYAVPKYVTGRPRAAEDGDASHDQARARAGGGHAGHVVLPRAAERGHREGEIAVLAGLKNLIGVAPDLLLRDGLLLDGRRNRLSRDAYLVAARVLRGRAASTGAQRSSRGCPRQRARASRRGVAARSAGARSCCFRYPSSYRPFNPAMTAEVAAFERNREGYLFLFRHEARRPRPLVLCVHGFQMGDPEQAKRLFRIQRLFGLELDVALFIQPHHWRRAEHPRNPFRQAFINPHDVPLTIEALGQALHDLRASYLLLEELGYERIALVGASLGGYACALYATVDDSAGLRPSSPSRRSAWTAR